MRSRCSPRFSRWPLRRWLPERSHLPTRRACTQAEVAKASSGREGTPSTSSLTEPRRKPAQSALLGVASQFSGLYPAK